MVRWGMIGAGDVCEHKSGPPLYGIDGSELFLIYRRNREAAEDFIARHGHGRYAASLDELNESPELDAVYVASPHDLHKEHTLAACAAGKHVLVEKPMALNSDQCTAMVEAARDAGVILGVAYYRRGYPSIRKIRGLLAEGAIGEPRSMSLCNEFPTSHRLDLVHYLLGDIATVRRDPEGDDPFLPERRIPFFEAVTVGGVQVRMAERWLETGMPESLWIEGSEGRIYLHDLKGGQLMLRRQDTPDELMTVPGLKYTHWGLIENFVAAVDRGEELLCSGDEGRKSTVVLDQLAECIPGDAPVNVSY